MFPVLCPFIYSLHNLYLPVSSPSPSPLFYSHFLLFIIYLSLSFLFILLHNLSLSFLFSLLLIVGIVIYVFFFPVFVNALVFSRNLTIALKPSFVISSFPVLFVCLPLAVYFSILHILSRLGLCICIFETILCMGSLLVC